MSKSRKVLFAAGVMLMALGAGYVSYSVASGIRARREEEVLHSIAFRETTAVTETAIPTTEPLPATTATEAPVTETETVEVTTTEAKEPYVSPIDFEALWEINEDIYAWIEIDDTNVSYPILQHPTDNDYYLFHTPEHRYGFPGSIYTFNVNAKDFSDFNTLIYGHRMDDDTMFSNLYLYRDESYLREHQTIKIYLPDRELHYTIFASVIYDDRLITSYYDFSDPDSCQAFLDSIYGNRDINSHILLKPKATVDDHLITLSTCIKWQKSNRYLIVAVLTDEID